MPGPLSNPKGWREKEPWDHGQSYTPGRTGKTEYDKRSGKWAKHIQNKNRRRDEK